MLEYIEPKFPTPEERRGSGPFSREPDVGEGRYSGVSNDYSPTVERRTRALDCIPLWIYRILSM